MNEMNSLIWQLGGVVCHQKAARSFVLNGCQFFLCARCTGIYLFLSAALLLSGRFSDRLSFRSLFFMTALSISINALTVAGLFDSNLFRFAFGSLIGASCGLIISKSINILKGKGESV